MKVLVYDSYEEDFEAAEEVGIELEKIDDLQEFDSKDFAKALLEDVSDEEELGA